MSQSKGFSHILLLILVAVIGVLVVVRFPNILNPSVLDSDFDTEIVSDYVPEPTETSEDSPTPTEENASLEDLSDLIKSPDQRYTLELTKIGSFDTENTTDLFTDKCSYKMLGNNNKPINLMPLFNSEFIKCAYSIIATITKISFSGDLLVYEAEDGVVRTMNLQTNKVSSFKFDSSKYKFLAADGSSMYYLLEDKGSVLKPKYILVDSSNKTVMEDIQISDLYKYFIIYDAPNNGFLLITDEENSDTTIVNKFYLLDLETFQLKNLLTISNEPQGRGCDPNSNEIISKKGEIRLQISCLGIDSKYLDSSHFLNLKI